MPEYLVGPIREKGTDADIAQEETTYCRRRGRKRRDEEYNIYLVSALQRKYYSSTGVLTGCGCDWAQRDCDVFILTLNIEVASIFFSAGASSRPSRTHHFIIRMYVCCTSISYMCLYFLHLIQAPNIRTTSKHTTTSRQNHFSRRSNITRHLKANYKYLLPD